MKPDQERVNNLLRDTVTLLCKNGLTYNDELRVEALIGVTVDSNDVFLVHINERFGPGGETKTTRGSSNEVSAQEERVNNGGGGISISNNSSAASSRDTPHQSPSHPVQRTGSTDSGSVSSPGWGARGGASSTHTPQVDLSRVKLESVEAGEDGLDPEDCVMIMGRSPQAVARQAHMVAGQRRILSHHHPSSLHHSQHPSTSQDDAQAMRRQYSQSLASSDGSFTDYDPDSSEPPLKVKKQAADGGEEDQGGGGNDRHAQDSTSTYYQQHHLPHTQHHHSGGAGGPGSSQWPNLADIAAQQAAHQAFQDDTDSGGGGTGTLPGCSSWPLPPGSQRAMLQGSQGADMFERPEGMGRGTGVASAEACGMYRVRRSVHAQDKPYVCTHPGCKKAFYHRPNLYRHRKDHRMDRSLATDRWSSAGGQAMGGLPPGRYLPTFGIFMTPVPNATETTVETAKEKSTSASGSISPTQSIGDPAT